METVFGTSFEYKLIYVFAINDEAHKGLLKIGDTTIQSNASIDTLFPNCRKPFVTMMYIGFWKLRYSKEKIKTLPAENGLRLICPPS